MWNPPAHVRKRIYEIATALVPALVTAGLITDGVAGSILTVLGVLLGGGAPLLAARNMTVPATSRQAAALPVVQNEDRPAERPAIPPGHLAFPNKRKAELYGTAAWMRVLRASVRGDGTLVNRATGQAETIGGTWPADDELESFVRLMPLDALAQLRASFDNFPVSVNGEVRTAWFDPTLDTSGWWIIKQYGG